MFARKVKSVFDRLIPLQVKFKKTVSPHKKYFYPGEIFLMGRDGFEVIEYYIDWFFVGILWWFLRFFQTPFPELVHMAFVGVFRSLYNIDQFANSLFDSAYFPECNVVFVGLWNDFDLDMLQVFSEVRGSGRKKNLRNHST